MIGRFSNEGEPLEPKSVADAFTTQCGCLVRDMVPISIQYWYKPKASKGEPEEAEPEEGALVNYVTKVLKDRLWESLIPHFNLSATKSLEVAEKQKEKVREWALKKMDAQFNNHNKRLWTAYVNADRQAPEFTSPNENLQDHYILGPGGYKRAVPKWNMQEAAPMRKRHRTRNRTMAQKVKKLGTCAWGCLR
jgi:hypothetical protein